MAATQRQILGRTGERLALEHYERRGFALVERNFRTREGEIDLILHDGETTVFVEVKARRLGGLDPLLSIGTVKRRRLRRAAAMWLSERPNRPRTRMLRFDAVAVVIDARGRLVALEQVEGIA